MFRVLYVVLKNLKDAYPDTEFKPEIVCAEEELQTELCRKVSLQNVEHISKIQVQIASLAQELGVVHNWPIPSVLSLFAFCKELRKAHKNELPMAYSSTGQLLLNMNTPEVSTQSQPQLPSES